MAAVRPGRHHPGRNPGARPREVYEEETLRAIPLRVPASQVEAIDARARDRGRTRYEFLRHAISQAILAG